MRIKHALFAALTGATLLAAPVQASELTKSDVEQIVRDYLVKNPEILVEMSNALRAKQESQQAENDKTLIEAHAKQLFANQDPESGNPKGSLTVVEFFDYNCGYCKKALADTRAILDKEKDVKIILKEFPILSEGSVEAAKVAAAVNILDPKAYEAFHFDLMSTRGQADGARALAAATKAGLDETKVKDLANKPQVAEVITHSYDLARKLNINGTPAYIIGDELVYGAVGFAELSQKIEAMRACGKATC